MLGMPADAAVFGSLTLPFAMPLRGVALSGHVLATWRRRQVGP